MSGPEPEVIEARETAQITERAQEAVRHFQEFLRSGTDSSRQAFLRIFRDRGEPADLVLFNTQFEMAFDREIRNSEEFGDFVSTWESAMGRNYVNMINDVHELYEQGTQLANLLSQVLVRGRQEDVAAFTELHSSPLFAEHRSAGFRRHTMFFERSYFARMDELEDESNTDPQAVSFRRVRNAYALSLFRLSGALNDCYRRLGADGTDERIITELRQRHGDDFIDDFIAVRRQLGLSGRSRAQILEYLQEHTGDANVQRLRNALGFNVTDIVRDIGAIHQALQGEDFPTQAQIQELEGRYGVEIVRAVRVTAGVPTPVTGTRATRARATEIETARQRIRDGIELVQELEEFLRRQTVVGPDGESITLLSAGPIESQIQRYQQVVEALRALGELTDRQLYNIADDAALYTLIEHEGDERITNHEMVERLRNLLPASLSNVVQIVNSAVGDARNFSELFDGSRSYLSTLGPMWFSRAETLIRRIEQRGRTLGDLYGIVLNHRLGGEGRFELMEDIIGDLGPLVATAMDRYLTLTNELGTELPPVGQEDSTATMERVTELEATFDAIRRRIEEIPEEMRGDLLDRICIQFYSQWHLDFVSDEIDDRRPYMVAIESTRRMLTNRAFMQDRIRMLTIFTERPLTIERGEGLEPVSVDMGEVIENFTSLSLETQYEIIRIARLMGAGHRGADVTGSSIEAIRDEDLVSIALIVNAVADHSPAYTPYMLRQIGQEMVEQLEPSQVETVIGFIMGMESAYITAGDYVGLQGWYSSLPERWREFTRLTPRRLLMEAREGGEESMDVRIQLPSEDEDYVSVVRPSGQVMFQIPIHVYTAWREEGLIDVDIPPTIRERLPPSIRDTAAPMPSPADVELRYFQGGIIDATLHTPDASIRIAMTLENLHRLAPDRLPQLGPMYEWEASIGGDYSYVGDTWLAGVRLTDRWEGFGPSVWTDFSFRGSDTMREIRAEGEGHNLGTDRRIVGYDFDIEVNQVLDELGETSETTDAEEIALTTVAPDANSLVYFRRDSVTGQMRAEFYVREAGVLARGQYIDLTEAEAEALYEHIFAEEEELVRRTYAEMAYGTERGQIGLDGCVLIFPGAEDTEATLQGIGTYEGIRGFVMGGALEATRGGRAMVQAGGMNPSERRFGIGRIFLSGLGIGGIVPDSAIATTEETDEDEEEEELARTAGDRIQLEGWVMRSQRYNIRAFADFALGQLATGEENQLIGGGFGTILQMVREADAWGLGAVGSFSPRQTHEQTIEEPEEQTEYTDEHTVDRIAGSGYYVGQGVLDAIVASILLEDDANTGRFSGGARFNIVPRDLIIELVGGYETDEETEEDAIEDTTIDAGGSIGVLRIPLTSEGYEIPGERRGAAALRIRWDPEDAVARIDAVEGLVIAYQRDEQIIPVVGGEIETDEDADVAARLEAYWLGPSGFGAHGTLTFPAGSTDVTLVAGGGIPPSAIGREGFGLHGGFRVAHPTGRWRTFLVGSYQQDGEVAGATPREDEDELIETAETEVEEETEEETDVVVADHIGTAMLAGIWDIGEDGTAATRARTSLTLALSWMGQWFEDSEEAAHQIDAQARLSRRSPTATVEGIVGTTTHIIPESWTQLLTIGLEMQRRTSLGRMQNPFLRLEYTHDLAGGGEIERRGDIRFTLTGGAEF